jgi:hypothetical protein
LTLKMRATCLSMYTRRWTLQYILLADIHVRIMDGEKGNIGELKNMMCSQILKRYYKKLIWRSISANFRFF